MLIYLPRSLLPERADAWGRRSPRLRLQPRWGTRALALGARQPQDIIPDTPDTPGTGSAPGPAPLAFASAALKGVLPVPGGCRAPGAVPPAPDTHRLAPGEDACQSRSLGPTSSRRFLWTAPERRGTETLSRHSPAGGTSPGYPAHAGRLGSSSSKGPAHFLHPSSLF